MPLSETPLAPQRTSHAHQEWQALVEEKNDLTGAAERLRAANAHGSAEFRNVMERLSQVRKDIEEIRDAGLLG